MMKQLRYALAAAVLSLSSAQAQTLVFDVLEGHDGQRTVTVGGQSYTVNVTWSTEMAGPYSLDLATKTWTPLVDNGDWLHDLDNSGKSWNIVGNCGAIHKGHSYWTFNASEAASDEDPMNLDTEYGYAATKITVRQWDDTTWKQIGETKTFPTSSRLAFTDLTYDATEDEVYCVYQVVSGSGDNAFSAYRFGTLDLESLTVTNLSTSDYSTEVRALAAHPNGNLYAIDYSGYFYMVNKQNGELTRLGYTGHKNQRRMQTMCADWSTGKLYFAGYVNDGRASNDRTGINKKTALYEVNVENGSLTQIFEFPAREMVTGMYVVGDIVPKVHDLKVSAIFPEQLVAGKLSSVTATVKNLGTENAEAYTINVVLDKQVVASIKGTNLAPGQSQDVDLSFTPSVGLGSDVRIYVNVEMEGDQNDTNNRTLGHTIRLLQTTLPTVNLVGMYSNGKVDLLWEAPTSKALTETFENYSPFIISGIGDWTLIDQSGKQATTVMQDGLNGRYEYPNAGKPFAWQIFNPKAAGFHPDQYETDTCTYYCQSGNQMLIASVGAVPAADGEGFSYVQANEWLISPELSGKAQTISFFAKCWTSQVQYYNIFRHYPEMFRVLYSTTDTNPESFTLLADTTSAKQWFSDGAYSYELPEGAKYFAIQRVTNPFIIDTEQSYTFGQEIQNGFFLFIDDITYTPAPSVLKGFNIYKNGEKVNAEPLAADKMDYQLSGINASEYSWFSVTAVYDDGESAPSNIFTVGQGTGIRATTATTARQSVYSLTGKHMGNSLPTQRGIYLVNGKKVAIK